MAELRPLSGKSVRLTYQPPASSTFLSKQTSHQYFSPRTNQHQPSAKRTGLLGEPAASLESGARGQSSAMDGTGLPLLWTFPPVLGHGGPYLVQLACSVKMEEE
jgi:hypothetical protein